MNKKVFELDSKLVRNQILFNERFRQAKTSFNFTIWFVAIGALTLILSVFLIFINDKSLGYLGIVIAGIFKTTAVFIFYLYKNSNNRLDILMNLPIPPTKKNRNNIPSNKKSWQYSDSSNSPGPFSGRRSYCIITIDHSWIKPDKASWFFQMLIFNSIILNLIFYWWNF